VHRGVDVRPPGAAAGIYASRGATATKVQFPVMRGCEDPQSLNQRSASMADDKRKPASRRAGASTGAKGTSGGGRRTRQATTTGTDIDAQNATGSGPGAGSTDDTAPTAAELGGGTADGDGLTAAALTASSLGDEALADASEPIVIVESLTVLSATPLDGAGVDDTSDRSDAASDGSADAQQRWLMIAERAYLRASERGFAPGGELDDWLNAERAVDAQLGGG
jgi:hypothetical protein